MWSMYFTPHSETNQPMLQALSPEILTILKVPQVNLNQWLSDFEVYPSNLEGLLNQIAGLPQGFWLSTSGIWSRNLHVLQSFM